MVLSIIPFLPIWALVGLRGGVDHVGVTVYIVFLLTVFFAVLGFMVGSLSSSIAAASVRKFKLCPILYNYILYGYSSCRAIFASAAFGATCPAAACPNVCTVLWSFFFRIYCGLAKIYWGVVADDALWWLLCIFWKSSGRVVVALRHQPDGICIWGVVFGGFLCLS